jgi:hypothetical protein
MKTLIIILVLAAAGFVAYKKFFAKKSAPTTPTTPTAGTGGTTGQAQ